MEYVQYDRVNCEPKRTFPSFKVDAITAKVLGEDFDVLPLFENAVFKYVLKNHYSLETNEFLSCQWKKFKHDLHNPYEAKTNYEKHNARDFHFYNCKVRYLPAQSTFRRKDFKKTLKPGPQSAYDNNLPLPIPDELLMKRSPGTPKMQKKSTKAKEHSNNSTKTKKNEVFGVNAKSGRME